MPESPNYLDQVGFLLKKLEDLHFQPVLVGGMALVLLGSQRVTRDFDFVISKPSDENLKDLIVTFYKHGFELVSKLDKFGKVVTTIDNPNVAALRLRIDHPASAYFFNIKTELRIDLLFDFPIAAAELIRNAVQIKAKTHSFLMASKTDLIRLKQIAKERRNIPSDAQDLDFLQKLTEN